MTTVHADLYFPMYVAGRDVADRMADRLGDVAGRSLVVDATTLISGTSSFAAQLVQRLLDEGKAEELIVVGAPEQFAGFLSAAAAECGRADALTFTDRYPPGVRP